MPSTYYSKNMFQRVRRLLIAHGQPASEIDNLSYDDMEQFNMMYKRGVIWNEAMFYVLEDIYQILLAQNRTKSNELKYVPYHERHKETFIHFLGK